MRKIYIITIILSIIFCSKNPSDTGGNSNISGKVAPITSGQLMLGEKYSGNNVIIHRKVAFEKISSNGEFEFNGIKNGNYNLIFFPDDHMPLIADTILYIRKEGNYTGVNLNFKIQDFPKQIDTIFTIPSRANLDSVVGPVQIRVSEYNSGGLAYLNLHIKNEMPAKVKFNLEFKYPSQQIAFDEILHLLELSVYKSSELFDCNIFTDFKDPLNPGVTLIYETYLAIPAVYNTSTYKVKCRLWGNYE